MKRLDEIIGVEEAAEILGLTQGTVKNMCKEKRLPCKKISNVWVMSRIMIEEVKEERRKSQVKKRYI